MSQSLPRGWAETTLGELLPISYGKALSASARRTGDVPVYGSSGVVGTHADALTSGATIIVGRKGNVGATHLSPVPCWPIDTVYFHDAGKKDVRFQAYLLRSLQLYRLDRSTTIPGLSRDDYNVVRVALPPEGEQVRIVEALESNLSRLDAAVANLEAAQRKLRAYRASVLKAAIEGRLVPTEADTARTEGRLYEPADVLLQRILKERRRRWEDAELAKMKAAGKTPKDNRWKDKYSEPTLDKRELPSLPEGWQWARLDQVSEVQLGQQRAPVHAAASDQLPYVRAANITWDGLDLGDVKTMGFPNPERYRLKFGDVLLSEASGSPMEAGKPAVWRDEIPDACYQKTLIRVRTLEPDSLLPTYLRLVFLRDCVTGKFARLAPGVGIVHLTAERMLRWAIPVPPLTEQQRIVDEVERLETVQNSVRAAIARERARIVRLGQAILTWAFDGRLVQQVPGDEPAESLLGRIRAESAVKTPTTPKARRARKLRAAS